MTKACFRKEMNDGIKVLLETVMEAPKCIVMFLVAFAPMWVYCICGFLNIIEFNLLTYLGSAGITVVWLVVIGIPFITCYICPSIVIEEPPKIEDVAK